MLNLLVTTPSTDNKTYTLELCQGNIYNGYNNLKIIFSQATKAERKNGMAWYGIALYGCFYLSETYNVPLTTVVNVVAAVSPSTRWTVNIQIAEIIIRHFISEGFVPDYYDYKGNGGTKTLNELSSDPRLPKMILDDGKGTPVTGANLIKALWCLQGFDALSGPKVTSFADNIFRFLESGRVTVDSHAINAWFGVTYRQSVALAAPSFYDIIAADYIRLAVENDISPLECQAIIWVVLRRISGSDKGDGIIPDRFIPTVQQMARMMRQIRSIYPPII